MKLCGFEGCGRPVDNKKRGLCNGHGQQQWMGKELTPLRQRNRNAWTGPECKVESCTRPGRSRGLCTAHASISWRMSVHVDDLPGVLAQETCQICGTEFEEGAKRNLDHDHSCCPDNASCGLCLRGVLCQSCNLRLNWFEKDPGLALKFLNYLESPPGITARPYEAATVDTHVERKKRESNYT